MRLCGIFLEFLKANLNKLVAFKTIIQVIDVEVGWESSCELTKGIKLSTTYNLSISISVWKELNV